MTEGGRPATGRGTADTRGPAGRGTGARHTEEPGKDLGAADSRNTGGRGTGAPDEPVSEEERVLGLPSVPPHGTVAYGPHPDQVIDFWHPAGTGRASGEPGGPTAVVLLHGGFWRHCYDRTHLSPLAARLAHEGYAVASVEYRRVGAGGGYPGTFDDVGAALAALRERAGTGAPGTASRPGESPEVPGGFRRPVLVGHSAGGQLALWAVSRRGAAPRGVARVVALAPVADLARAVVLGTGGGAVEALFGGDLSRLPEADPVALLPTGIPTSLIHGRDDEDVPVGLSERFTAAARLAGDDARLTVLDGLGHYALIDPGSERARTALTKELDRSR